MPETLVFLKYSAINSDVENAKGIHKIRARNEVIKVPVIKGKAP